MRERLAEGAEGAEKVSITRERERLAKREKIDLWKLAKNRLSLTWICLQKRLELHPVLGPFRVTVLLFEPEIQLSLAASKNPIPPLTLSLSHSLSHFISLTLRATDGLLAVQLI